MGPLSFVHPEDLPGVTRELAALFDGTLSTVRHEARLLDADRDVIWSALTVSLVRDDAGEAVHAVLQVQDVSEQKRYEGQLQHLADHDALTGLFNRRRFEEELEREVASARRYGTRGAVMVLDLDHFKYVNDSLGHAAGDELIVSVANALRARLRATDLLCRMGGDEFAVILPRADEHEARQTAESVLGAVRVESDRAHRGRTWQVTASIGIALFGGSDDEFDAEQLLAAADIAMYDAKAAGRDRVAVYDPSGSRHERMQTRRARAQRIAAAIDEDRFVLHAQPIRSLSDPEEERYELLLRMIGDEGELIPPGTFLYVAERSDLAPKIDRWVIARAVEVLAAQGPRDRPATFEINLSAKSIDDDEMPDFIASAVGASGIDPRSLIFELTETAAIVNLAKARTFAERIEALGCRFALDDFGAGFASFYYLKHLSFDYVKIDGEFIEDLPSNHTNQLVVRAVVDIARGLGKQTIAEFVCDDVTVELLREYGVDYAQGFHIGRPLPLEELALEQFEAPRRQ
jgi:diguanylate cyclase (GGDEF)-like protein